MAAEVALRCILRGKVCYIKRVTVRREARAREKKRNQRLVQEKEVKSDPHPSWSIFIQIPALLHIATFPSFPPSFGIAIVSSLASFLSLCMRSPHIPHTPPPLLNVTLMSAEPTLNHTEIQNEKKRTESTPFGRLQLTFWHALPRVT